jgi:membrane protease subunit HflK
MAWNEPGGHGDKDPWSRRDREQGPPDLDEVVRKLQTKLGGLFGGGGGTGRGWRGSAKGIWIIVGLIVLLWLASGIYIVDPAERGVVFQFGRYVATTPPGPHWHIPYPVQRVEIVDVDQIRNVEVGYRSQGASQPAQSVPKEALMLTQDENIIDIKLAVQYRVKSAPDYLFNVREPDVTLRKVIESSVREIIGKSRLDFVLTEGRSEVAARVGRLIQETMDSYESGLQVTSVNMQNAQPPEQVQEAFFDAIKAREDEQRVKNEAEAYANDVVPRARGAAARRLEEANAYRAEVTAQAEGEASRFVQVLDQYQQAPEVTRERLYLDTMEAVLGTTNKVLVDVKEGGNLLVLPLDQITKTRGAAGDTLGAQAGTATASPAIPTIDLRDPGRLRSRSDR